MVAGIGSTTSKHCASPQARHGRHPAFTEQDTGQSTAAQGLCEQKTSDFRVSTSSCDWVEPVTVRLTVGCSESSYAGIIPHGVASHTTLLRAETATVRLTVDVLPTESDAGMCCVRNCFRAQVIHNTHIHHLCKSCACPTS